MPSVQTDFPHEVTVIENIFIPLADGTRLAARVWMPEGAGPVPVLLEYLPYRKRDGTRERDDPMHGLIAGHGYACIRLDIRGTGDSDGVITGEYTAQELADGVEAIAWLAAQEWCDGQVAMIGISWGGFNGLQIAALQPPALKTVITVGSTDDRYATDIHWVGGCLSKDNFDWSSTMFAAGDMPPDPAIVGARWREMWMQRIAANRPWILDWLQHQRRDRFWQHGSICEDFSAVKVPVYAVSGWADNYSESVPRLLAGLRVPRKGLIGPWAHSYPMDVTVQPEIGWLAEVLRWLDHWLKGIDTGVMAEPMFRVWMQESVPPQTCYTQRPGHWVCEPSWPSPRIAPERHFLNRAGLSPRPAPSEQMILCSPLWVGLASGELGRYGEDADWPTDQREDDGGSLVFRGPALAETVEILGAPRLHIRFSVNRPQALVAVRLNDVAPDGQSTRVCLGLLNLTHRDSHEHPNALVPGQIYTAMVELDDIAHAFPAGHHIAVSISTSYFPVAWPSPELTTLSLHSGESWLELPVRPENPEDAGLHAFGPAVMAAAMPSTHHSTPPSHPRRITRDLLSGVMAVDFPRWVFHSELLDIDQTQSSMGYCRHEITDGDPLSARTITDYRVTARMGAHTFGHHSHGSLSCDATHFHVEMQVIVTEGGTEVHRQSWRESFARDMI